ncbi:hypothetical protein O6H91_20G010200 [Diphasiastrum complanatum]|uniref:Uncharacterized protein n=1 Tax=Diphasiastrum complanatum TaxID=34168 RepID=A0ACC2APE9_DIPCM|nr:hypothetical protein O6H91_20G010200 [Diphasiastrum complanatum]
MDLKLISSLVMLCFTVYLNQSYVMAAAKLDVLPTILKQSGDTVNLTWTNIQSPSPLDWIGIYSPPESKIDHYIGYLLLSSCISWTEGTCSLEVPLVNMRSGYQFRLYHGVPVNISENTLLDEDGNPLPSTATQLAVSKNVDFFNSNEPTQIHLSPTSSAQEMRVLFVIKDLIGSFVKYGLGSHSLSSIQASRTYSYKQSDMCHAPANSSIGWRDPGYFHDALLKGLEPEKRYFYQVLYLAVKLWMPVPFV